MQKTTITPTVTIDTGPNSIIEPASTTTFETELMTNEFDITAPTRILKNHPIESVIEGRKTKKNELGLKPTPRAWYEKLTTFLE